MSLSIRLVSDCGYDCFISTTSSPLSLLTALPTTSNLITASLHDIYWTAAAQRTTWSFGKAVMLRRNSDPRGPFSKEVGSELCRTRTPGPFFEELSTPWDFEVKLHQCLRVLYHNGPVLHGFFFFDCFYGWTESAVFWKTLITWPLLKPQRVLPLFWNFRQLPVFLWSC